MFAVNRNPPEGKMGPAQMDTKVVCGMTLRKDPARESCFKVVDTDAEMVAWADMSPQSRRERVHRHMSNEITSLEIAAQCLADFRSEEHTSELQSHSDLVCRLLLEKKK